MTSYPKQVEFYRGLVTLLRDKSFNTDYAQRLAALLASGEVIDYIIESPDVEIMHAWQELQDDAVEKTSLMMFVDHSFEVLAPHLRDPQNRELVSALIEISGATNDRTLFAHVSNVRLLGKDEDGPAVVTLVVHSMNSFYEWFRDPARSLIRCVHGSCTPDRKKDGTPSDGKTFTVGDSFRFAVQCPDPEVGISGSRCSNCNGPVAFCNEICKGCRMPIIGPGGMSTSIRNWKRLDTAEKSSIAEKIFSSHNHGRMGYTNVHSVPLTETELVFIEHLPTYLARSFERVHELNLRGLRALLTKNSA